MNLKRAILLAAVLLVGTHQLSAGTDFKIHVKLEVECSNCTEQETVVSTTSYFARELRALNDVRVDGSQDVAIGYVLRVRIIRWDVDSFAVVVIYGGMVKALPPPEYKGLLPILVEKAEGTYLAVGLISGGDMKVLAEKIVANFDTRVLAKYRHHFRL